MLLMISFVSLQAQTNNKEQKAAERIEDPDNLATEYFSQIMGVALSATSNLKLYQFVYDWIGTPYRLGGGTKKGIDWFDPLNPSLTKGGRLSFISSPIVYPILK